MRKTKIISEDLLLYKTVFTSFSEYNERYTQIQRLLDGILDPRLFASPRYLPNKKIIEWFVDTSNEQIIHFAKLSPAEQNAALQKLNNAINRVNHLADTQKSFTVPDNLDRWFEIPSEEFIYALRSPSGDIFPVLTMWGCLKDKVGSPSGILKIMMPKDEFPINIKLLLPESYEELAGIDVELRLPTGEVKTAATTIKGVAIFDTKVFEGSTFEVHLGQFDLTRELMCDGRSTPYEISYSPQALLEVSITKDHEQGIPDIPVSFRFTEDKEAEVVTFNTNEAGTTSLPNIPLGSKIEVKYKHKEEWSAPLEIEVDEYKKQLNFDLSEPIKVKILNSKKEPIPQLDLDVFVNDISASSQTDEEGYIQNLKLKPTDGIFVKAGYKGKKYKSKTLSIAEGKLEYEIILRSWRWLWWLLLPLLLLLILFIPVNNSLQIRALSSFDRLAVDNARVNMTYVDKNDTEFRDSTITDSLGYASFNFGKQFLYEKLLKPYPKGNVKLFESCYRDTTISLARFSKMSSNTILLPPRMLANLDFVIKSKPTGIPVSGALLRAEIEYHGQIFGKTIIDTSNFGGTVTLQEVPLCARIRLIASKALYLPDTIEWVSVEQIARNLEDRMLYIDPQFTERTFYVRSTMTGDGLPMAKILGHIESGNAVLDSVKLRASSSADGSFRFPVPNQGKIYMKGSLLGYHDSIYYKDALLILSAKDKDSLTLWLRPETQAISFTVLDTLSLEPISQASVEVNCNLSPGSRKKGLTDSQGKYYTNEISLCYLTVKASHPDYQAKIVKGNLADFQENPQKRTIYLRPIPPPGAVSDCSPQSKSIRGQTKPHEEESYFLKKESGRFKFEYNTYTQKDRVEIFCGNDKIFSYFGGTGGVEDTVLSFNESYVKVVVTGSSDWDYTVYCPE